MPPHPTTPRILLADSDDLDALVTLEDRVFPHDRIDRRAWRHLVTRARGRVIVARAAGSPDLLGAAVVLLPARPRTARLYSIAVAPEARGSGVGSRLLEAVLGIARAAGKERLRLEVRTDNERAIALYEVAGFDALERLPDYYAEGAAGLRMERGLADIDPTPWKHLFRIA